jgi:uncharacterized UBP type Zn finger protein
MQTDLLQMLERMRAHKGTVAIDTWDVVQLLKKVVHVGAPQFNLQIQQDVTETLTTVLDLALKGSNIDNLFVKAQAHDFCRACGCSSIRPPMSCYYLQARIAGGSVETILEDLVTEGPISDNWEPCECEEKKKENYRSQISLIDGQVMIVGVNRYKKKGNNFVRNNCNVKSEPLISVEIEGKPKSFALMAACQSSSGTNIDVGHWKIHARLSPHDTNFLCLDDETVTKIENLGQRGVLYVYVALDCWNQLTGDPTENIQANLRNQPTRTSTTFSDPIIRMRNCPECIYNSPEGAETCEMCNSVLPDIREPRKRSSGP